MDDVKLFAKNERKLETLLLTGRIFSQDIGIEFGIEKCAILEMKNGKRHMTEGTAILNQEKNQNDQGNLQILGNIGSWHHKKVEMK